MGATVTERGEHGGRGKSVHVVYALHLPDGMEHARESEQYQVYRGRRRLPFIIRIQAMFSGAPYSPRGAELLLMETRPHRAFGTQIGHSVDDVRIRDGVHTNLALIAPVGRDIRVRRVGRHSKRLKPEQVHVVGW